jgi:hypothetical protein
MFDYSDASFFIPLTFTSIEMQNLIQTCIQLPSAPVTLLGLLGLLGLPVRSAESSPYCSHMPHWRTDGWTAVDVTNLLHGLDLSYRVSDAEATVIGVDFVSSFLALCLIFGSLQFYLRLIRSAFQNHLTSISTYKCFTSISTYKCFTSKYLQVLYKYKYLQVLYKYKKCSNTGVTKSGTAKKFP